MKYNSQLIEATLLRRPISFLMEVVLQSKRRIMVRCPNLGPLAGCDILGTQLWFSAPSGDHCLPTLELVEVNGGFWWGLIQKY
jgi:DNA-binding sugar fermentation-stimulating protein